MNNDTYIQLNKVAFVGDYLPRRCGIATFTRDLRHAVANEFPETECEVVAVSDRQGSYNYPTEVRFEITQEDLKDYRRAAEFLKIRDTQCVCVQHEFGIYGGSEGKHLLNFLHALDLPVATTCHTILEHPTPLQRQTFEDLIDVSDRLVTMSQRGREILHNVYRVSDDKINVIPHGIPDAPFIDPAFHKDQFGVEGKKVLLTFGLLSPGKGIEYAIQALPRIVETHPDVVYIVLGATHPNLVRRKGEAYRTQLQQLAKKLGVEQNVMFFDRFVSLKELTKFIGACDIYLTPYLNPEQITSGTLAYAFGCGKAVISTPYWHAEELLANGRGRLIPFRDAEAIANEAIALLDDDRERARIRKDAYMAGRSMLWNRVAQSYMNTFQEARLAYTARTRVDLEQELGSGNLQFPEISLDHLSRMTDSTGLFQHAIYTFPDFEHGYCIDDNARALILTCKLEEAHAATATSTELSGKYAAFINYAFDPSTGRFKNFMGFDRNWLEEVGSEDSHGRALWALGTCVGCSSQSALRQWAANLFERALPAILDTRYPKTWAFALVGLHEYLQAIGGHRAAQSIRTELATRLVNLFDKEAKEEWQWFEPILSYDNAKLPHAMIATGRATGERSFMRTGLRSLEWLMKQQTSEEGFFSPIGSNGFFPKGGRRAEFDQQPLEAQSTVSACLEAYLATRHKSWLEAAMSAFRWFLGGNKLGLSVYNHRTGGCRDGLHIDRLNQNEGAESTLAFLLAQAEMKRHEQTCNTLTSIKTQTHSNAPSRQQEGAAILTR